MIYYFLISIVFLAELIIALTLVINLIKLDRKVNDINNFLDEALPSIKKNTDIDEANFKTAPYPCSYFCQTNKIFYFRPDYGAG